MQWDREDIMAGNGAPSTGLKHRESFRYAPLPKTTEVILWIGTIAGFVVSVLSALNICNSACSDSATYTFFGLNIGWFGVLFFTVFIGTLALSHRFAWAELLFILQVFAASGAELRFIWLQKYVIGKWCPLCLSIAGLIYLMVIVLLHYEWRKARTRGATMKGTMKLMTAVMLAIVVGLSGTILGVKKNADAAELNLFLGKADSATVVYFVSDWFCPACRRTEPAIAKMYPKIASIAKVGFVDIPVHPETSNFTPYNMQSLVYEKGKYIQLRGALGELAKKTKAPSPDDINKATAPLGVKLHTINYADIASVMSWNENIFRTYEIRATPTVVVMNEKTRKHVNLVGENEISYQSVLKAIGEVEK